MEKEKYQDYQWTYFLYEKTENCENDIYLFDDDPFTELNLCEYRDIRLGKTQNLKAVLEKLDDNDKFIYTISSNLAKGFVLLNSNSIIDKVVMSDGTVSTLIRHLFDDEKTLKTQIQQELDKIITIASYIKLPHAKAKYGRFVRKLKELQIKPNTKFENCWCFLGIVNGYDLYFDIESQRFIYIDRMPSPNGVFVSNHDFINGIEDRITDIINITLQRTKEEIKDAQIR